MTIVWWPENKCLDLHFHIKREVRVWEASLIAEKRMHAVSLYPRRMKINTETDSKTFFPHGGQLNS